VFDALWKLDAQRGSNSLFRDIEYDRAKEIFPIFMRFFDTFHIGDFTDIRNQLNILADSTDYDGFLLSSLDKVIPKKGMTANGIRTSFAAKYSGYKKNLPPVRRQRTFGLI
jgi:hypothetical protein